MATDDRTPIQHFPRPHTANTVAEDFARIITLVNMLEAKISALDGQISGKAASGHTHPISGVDGLQAALDARQAADWRPALGDLANVNVTGAASGQFLGLIGATWQPVTLSVAWGNISGKPSAFPTTWGDVTGKPATYPPSAHGHPVGEISGLQAALDAKLSLAGGTLTGPLYLTSGNPGIQLSKTASGQAAFIRGTLTGSHRWHISLGNEAAETGNSSGSDFSIYRVDDAGTYRQVLYVMRDSGHMDLGSTRINGGDASLEVNVAGNGNRFAYVDLHSHGTAFANDYSARMMRMPGVNGELDFYNTGTGWTRFFPGQNCAVQIGNAGQYNYLYVARLDNGSFGGRIILQRCVTNTSIFADVAI